MQRGVTVAVAVLVVLTAFAGVAAATETRAGGTVIVEENETVQGLDAYGGTVIVRGTVEGNLTAYGGVVRIDGRVTGDVTAVGGAVTVAPNATVGGDLRARAGSVSVAGLVAGDAVVSAPSVGLLAGGIVRGDVIHDGEFAVASGGTVGGTVTRRDDVTVVEGFDPGIEPWMVGAYVVLADLLFGAVLYGFFPGASRNVATAGRTDTAAVVGTGLAALIGIPLFLLVMVVSVIGIPVALLGLVVLLPVVWAARVYGRIVVGAWLLAAVDRGGRWPSLVVGVGVVALLTRVPVVGVGVGVAVFLLGLGALGTVFWERRRWTAPPEGETDGRPSPVQEASSDD